MRNQNIPQKDRQIPSGAAPLNRGAVRKSGSFHMGNKTGVIGSAVVFVGNRKREMGKSEPGDKSIGQKSGEISKAQLQSVLVAENSINKENTKAAPGLNETTKTVTADSVSDIKTIKDKSQKTKKSNWSVGFTAGAGVSNVNQSLFKSQNTADLSASLYNTPANNVGTPASMHTPTESSAGFSFNLGVYVKRNLSKRISASAGLGYHYYSTRMHTGISVDSVYMVNFSYLQAAMVNSYYRNGDGHEFTNQYHFIELPVNISFQLNKSRKNPVNWEAGMSLAWLVSTNALHFDPYNNVYFENSQLFNQVQWHAVTSLMVGFPFHDHTIQIGPQVQYGLTGLLKNSGSNPGHLTYFGLKCTFNP
jgi:hypothetical protein